MGTAFPSCVPLEMTPAPIPHICTKLVNVKGCWQNFGRAPRIGEHWDPAPRYGGHDRPVGINRRYPKNLGIHDHLQTLPTMWATMPNLMADGQTVRECMCGHPPEKPGSSRPALQGHSRLLELTRIYRVPMASY